MAFVSNRYYSMLDKKGPEVLHYIYKLEKEQSQNSHDLLKLRNKPAQPFFTFTAPLYFQVQDQACVPFTVASSLAVLVNSQEQRVLYCDLLRLH